jgi:hypothetical protein
MEYIVCTVFVVWCFFYIYRARREIAFLHIAREQKRPLISILISSATPPCDLILSYVGVLWSMARSKKLRMCTHPLARAVCGARISIYGAEGVGAAFRKNVWLGDAYIHANQIKISFWK